MRGVGQGIHNVTDTHNLHPLAYAFRTQLSDGRRHKVHAPELVRGLGSVCISESSESTMSEQNVKCHRKRELGEFC